MLIALLISISLSTFYYGRISFVVGEVWSPPEQCSGFPSNYSAPVYEQYVQNRFLSEDSAALKTFSIVDGLLKLIASTTLPIFTYLLTKEHHNAKSTRRQLGTPRLEEPKNDHTTKLVILMAITFIVSESPFGILYFVEGIIINSPGIIHLTSDLIDLFGIFLAINATTSCLICLAVSSQYRKTAKELINYGRKKPTTVSLRKHLTSSATSKSFSMKTIN